MNMVMASPKCETPAPVPENQTAESKSSLGGKEFAKKLKDCEKEDISGTQVKDTGETGDEKKDNGRQSNSAAINAVYGIAGILEGFGSLSYQTDNTAPVQEAKGIAIDPQAAAVPQTGSGELAKAADTVTEQGKGMSEQIAWMLQKQDTGEAPAQTQDEILKTIGEYLDSLENTSNVTDGQAIDVQPNEAASIPEIISNTQNKIQNNIKDAVIAESQAELKQTEVSEDGNTAVNDVKKNDVDLLTVQTKDVSVDAKTTDTLSSVINAQGQKSSNGGNKDAQADSSKKEDGVKLDSNQQKAEDTSIKAAVTNTGETRSFRTAADTVVQTEFEPAVQQNTYTAGTMRENVVRIVDSVKTAATDGNYKFDIQLKPEFMGKVNITLSMKDDNLKVRIKTDDPTVKGMLSDQTSSLQNMFKEKGITVTSIEITYENPGMQYNDSQTFGQQNGNYNTGGNLYYEPAAEDDSFNTAAEQYNSYIGDSKIELFA